MNDRMRRGCCRLLALLLTLVLVIPAYGQETLDALAAAQGCTAETLLQSDKLTAGDSVSDWVAIAVSRTGTEGDTSAYRKALERYVTRMYREQGGLDRLRATEWQRTALTALALGADGVLIGRPFVTMVYGGGEEGVAAYVRKLTDELSDTMAMCGAHSLKEINREMLWQG